LMKTWHIYRWCTRRETYIFQHPFRSHGYVWWNWRVCMYDYVYIYIHEFANWNAHPSIPLCVVNSLSSWYNPHFGCVKSIILPGRIVTLWLIMAHYRS
jgi:uncharacterized membrane protein